MLLWNRSKSLIGNLPSSIIQIREEMRKSSKRYKAHMIPYTTRIREKFMTNMVWKVLKVVPELAEEWMIFSVCSWVEEVVELHKNKNNA